MITLTEKAAEKVKTHLANRNKGHGIKLGVRSSGCSGLSYVLEFVDHINPEDQVFHTNEVNVYVDPKSLIYLTGMVLDWKKEGLNEGFDFQNPNVKDECGCGESFRV